MKKVLITGASGVVGSAVLPHFLNNPEYEVTLLLRSKDESHLDHRVREVIEFVSPDLRETSFRNRLHAIRGDVTEQRLGLDSRRFEELVQKLTHVVHCAASVDLDMPLETSLQRSLGAVREIMKILDRQPRCKLEYVSTVGVGGKRRSPLAEEEIREAREFFNTYEAGKARAEEFVFQKMREGAQITIHRPSMVIGDSRSGRIRHFQVFYFLVRLMTGRLTRGFLPPFQDHRIDTIPMDFVGELIHASAEHPESSGRVLHHCSGWSDSLRIRDIQSIAIAEMRRQDLAIPRIRYLPIRAFQLLSMAQYLPFLDPRWSKRLSLFPQFLEYAQQEQDFRNEKTKALASHWKLSWPTAANSLPKSLEYFIRTWKR